MGSTIRFAFKGKSGKERKLSIDDRRMARAMRSLQDIPGQMLFQYLDGQGGLNAVTSNDVNAYIREASGGEFTSKGFRTWGGTVRALTLFAGRKAPDTDRMMRRACNEVIDEVATVWETPEPYVGKATFTRVSWRLGPKVAFQLILQNLGSRLVHCDLTRKNDWLSHGCNGLAKAALFSVLIRPAEAACSSPKVKSGTAEQMTEAPSFKYPDRIRHLSTTNELW